jgi:hypothetical protein
LRPPHNPTTSKLNTKSAVALANHSAFAARAMAAFAPGLAAAALLLLLLTVLPLVPPLVPPLVLVLPPLPALALMSAAEARLSVTLSTLKCV